MKIKLNEFDMLITPNKINRKFTYGKPYIFPATTIYVFIYICVCKDSTTQECKMKD